MGGRIRLLLVLDRTHLLFEHLAGDEFGWYVALGRHGMVWYDAISGYLIVASAIA